MIPNADKMRERIKNMHPDGRMTAPEDIARTIVALADPAIDWISGTVIKIDGGEDNTQV